LTLIDYPGRVAATVFTFGCNFRCGFCHNYDLMGDQDEKVMPVREKEFFDFLDSRVGKLDGVCVTGGEPTLQGDLIGFIEKIKEKDFLVKLDTNGSNPEMLETLLKRGLVDYVAMDIKAPLQKYAAVAGLPGLDLEKIKNSVKLVKKAPEYEFRTTVVHGLHTKEDLLEIIDWLKGSRKYFLQQYRAVNFPKNLCSKPLAPFPQKDLEEVLKEGEKNFEYCALRQ